MTGQAIDLRGLRVFISYPRSGLAHTWAKRVHAYLDERGAEVWRDEASIRPGDPNWYTRICEGLATAEVVACVLGLDSPQCQWQQKELVEAVERGTPVVALRVDGRAKVPLVIKLVQPVEVGRDEARALDQLAQALHDQAHAARSTASMPHEAAADPARQRELTYLGNLLHRELSDVEDAYVPVSGRQTRAASLARSRKVDVIRTDVRLRRRAAEAVAALDPQAEPEVFDDALTAYRALPQRTIRRLAVLGEPGAGKSFSLQRIACEYARRVERDPAAPLPLYVALGAWTRANQSLDDFVDEHLGVVFKGLRCDLLRLRDTGRAVLLLDGMNEIPPGQRAHKVALIRAEAEDRRYVSVVVSCRARDFEGDCALPFDELRLQPLRPWQVHDAIRQTMRRDADGDEAAGLRRTEALFWRLAGGDKVRDLWFEWEKAGAGFEQFWTAEKAPTEELGWRDHERRQARDDPRGLLKLAGNPYLLTLLMKLKQSGGDVPSNRADLFDLCLSELYDRERDAHALRHDELSVPPFDDWRAALVALAEALQRADGPAGDDGARTALARRDWPAALTEALIAFSIDASVLQRIGRDDLRFTHQLLQESLAADVLLDASRTGQRPASDFWPKDRWWQRSGWEVVAEIAAEACEGDTAAQVALIDWLAADHPGMAVDIWNHAGRPALPSDLLHRTAVQWCPRLTDTKAEPAPEARAAIGRWLGALDLDHRPGTGLRLDRVPDIDWVQIDDFEIGRYLVTNRQWQAFIDDGGYEDDRWWNGLAERMEPEAPSWSEPTAPRETVSWYEAMAYCRWLSAKLEQSVTLSTEQQWERAARGVSGREFAWEGEWNSDLANAEMRIQRTTAVGLYPDGATPEGIQDLTGNVWEWCLNEYENTQNIASTGTARRVVRGGAWNRTTEDCRASARLRNGPVNRGDGLGLRLVRGLGPHSEP